MRAIKLLNLAKQLTFLKSIMEIIVTIASINESIYSVESECVLNKYNEPEKQKLQVFRIGELF